MEVVAVPRLGDGRLRGPVPLGEEREGVSPMDVRCRSLVYQCMLIVYLSKAEELAGMYGYASY